MDAQFVLEKKKPQETNTVWCFQFAQEVKSASIFIIYR
jgi:hypothetical protein